MGRDGLEWSEAAYMHRHGGYYYLLLNVGACCRGLDSTYEIRMGAGDECNRGHILSFHCYDRERDGLPWIGFSGDRFVDRETTEERVTLQCRYDMPTDGLNNG